MSDKRMPFLQFYTRDWRAAAKLRLCSLAARGLWIDMLSLMAEAVPRGFLLIDGICPTTAQVAGLVGVSEREVKKLLRELDANNVYSVTGRPMPTDLVPMIPGDMPEGVIISRRIVRDEAKRAHHQANGRLGGNPRLKGEVNPRGYPSEIRNQRLESHGSSNSTVAPRALAPYGARTGTESRPQLTGAMTLWTIRLKGHLPGRKWDTDWGPPPESESENPNLDPQQRREWRVHYRMPPDWQSAA